MTETPSVGRFLSELERGLRGSPRWRAEVVAEIHAHLLDALEDVGNDLATAERIVDRFGDPVNIACEMNHVGRRVRWRPVGLRLSGAAAFAIAVLALGAHTGSERASGRDGSPTTSKTQLIGTVVAIHPASTELGVGPTSGATELVRLARVVSS